MRNVNTNLSIYTQDQVSCYSMQELDDVQIICYDSKIYVPQSLRRCVLDWFHFLSKPPRWQQTCKKHRGLCYWKCLVTQAQMCTKACKICQQFKKRKTIYRHLPPRNIAELKPWNAVHVDLIGPYIKSIRQQQPGGTVIRKNSSLTCMTMIDPATGWFEIFKIPTFDLEEVALDNDEYIDTSSARVSQMFNNTWRGQNVHFNMHKD